MDTGQAVAAHAEDLLEEASTAEARRRHDGVDQRHRVSQDSRGAAQRGRARSYHR